jgi:hypothetical protein
MVIDASVESAVTEAPVKRDLIGKKRQEATRAKSYFLPGSRTPPSRDQF